jgi:hypothetical protein
LVWDEFAGGLACGGDEAVGEAVAGGLLAAGPGSRVAGGAGADAGGSGPVAGSAGVSPSRSS